jgi:hypothetical protein
MPYSLGPDGRARTPGGCRVDNGRCFARIVFDGLGEWVTFHFVTGDVYTYEGPGITAFVNDFLGRPDPGCLWNALGPPATSDNLHRGGPLKNIDPTAIFVAEPPDYVPTLLPPP